MAVDSNRTKAYQNRVREIEQKLSENRDLFDADKLYEFREETEKFEQIIKTAEQKSRKLSIGIIGAVKAGKSSFLNACIFGGQSILPKAATPMTAALTRITYSETPKASIHFYDKEDWEKIEENAADYDKKLQHAYSEYQAEIQQQQNRKPFGANSKNNAPPKTHVLSIEQFERGMFQRDVSETLLGAKELTRMVTDPTLLEDKLGSTDVIDGDVISKLENYVGADGRYTPIVSYVEIQVNNPAMKNLEIVDTPGLNDPIVSRGRVTKKFLRSCDVVLLLSPCSQFMDDNTVTLMADSLPSADIRRILVIGSKLDSGILNESGNSFAAAWKKSIISYEGQYNATLSRLQPTRRNKYIVEKLKHVTPMFVSSVCFSIAQKRRSNVALNEEEQHVLTNLKRYGDFEEKYLGALGGMGKVQHALNEILEEKEKIIQEKNENLLNTTRYNHLRIIEKIFQDVVSSRIKLEKSSAEELKEQVKIIDDVIDGSRSKLASIFAGAAIGCKRKIEEIRPQLTLAKKNLAEIKITKSSHEKFETYRTGLFGWRKETVRYTVTEKEADTADAVKNIENYAAECQQYVMGEFNALFNREQFSNRIKEVILAALEKSGH